MLEREVTTKIAIRTRTTPTTSEPQTFGDLPLAIEIGALRQAAGMSHDELAKLSGLSPEIAEQIATGAIVPSPYRIHRICNALRIPFHDPRRTTLQHMAVDERVKRGLATILK